MKKGKISDKAGTKWRNVNLTEFFVVGSNNKKQSSMLNFVKKQDADIIVSASPEEEVKADGEPVDFEAIKYIKQEEGLEG